MKMFFLYVKMPFRRFNPEIEKLMLQMKSKNKTAAKEDEAVEFDMSNKETARRYETLMGTIGKKISQEEGPNRLRRRKMEL